MVRFALLFLMISHGVALADDAGCAGPMKQLTAAPSPVPEHRNVKHLESAYPREYHWLQAHVGEPVSLIGSGGTTVVLGVRQGARLVAGRIAKNDHCRQFLRREADALKTLQAHSKNLVPGTIPRLLAEDPETGTVAVDFMEGTPLSVLIREAGTLDGHRDFVDGKRKLEDLTQNQTLLFMVKNRWRIIQSVREAIRPVHQASIVHGDLKPSNILVRQPSPGEIEISIIDWGMAGKPGTPRIIRNDKTGEETLIGTSKYMPPGHSPSDPLESYFDDAAIAIIQTEMEERFDPYSYKRARGLGP